VRDRATRDSVGGRAYLDLQKLARQEHRPTDELHQMYALEGFLARLVISRYVDNFVLKGGVLLAAYDMRRATRDIDLQGQGIVADNDEMIRMVQEIACIALDDGLEFRTDSIKAETIREDDAYSGVRVSFSGSLSVAQLILHVDISVGDPVWPAPQRIALPRLLAGEIVLSGYPLSMVLAEKLVTAIDRGTSNTRWRDFGDIYLLIHRHDVDGVELTTAMTKVADYRHIGLAAFSTVLEGYAPVAQQRWAAWRRKHQLADRLPEYFEDVLGAVGEFADPTITGSVGRGTWIAASRSWQPHD
jgi:hypothetical protein